MPYCTNCEKQIEGSPQFCSHCGARQSNVGETHAKSQVESAGPESDSARKCPFCRQYVDARASRCPHCSGEIGLLENCVPCPKCSERVIPVQITATDEKGSGTALAKIALGGQYFLSAADETYLACPVCRTPISYCSNCQKVKMGWRRTVKERIPVCIELLRLRREGCPCILFGCYFSLWHHTGREPARTLPSSRSPYEEMADRTYHCCWLLHIGSSVKDFVQPSPMDSSSGQNCIESHNLLLESAAVS